LHAALTAPGTIPSEDAFRWLVDLTMAGLRPPGSPGSGVSDDRESPGGWSLQPLSRLRMMSFFRRRPGRPLPWAARRS
jgi:hypothetical protein